MNLQQNLQQQERSPRAIKGGHPARAGVHPLRLVRNTRQSPLSQSMSDEELLGELVGHKMAADLLKANPSLSQLFNRKPAPWASAAHAKLFAARELVRRSLAETLRERPALTSPRLVRDYLRLTMGQLEHEVFMLLFLDSQNRLIKAEEMFRGTIAQTSVYPREVVKQALHQNAAAVILAHNHPSGNPEPSQADHCLTKTLKEALIVVEIRVLDHLVIAHNAIYSFAEHGVI